MQQRSEPIVFTTRRHWASLLDRGLLPHLMVIIVSRWLDMNLRGNQLFGFALPWTPNNVNAFLNLIAFIAFMWMVIAFISRYLNWQFNALYVTPSQVIYRAWPVSEDRIPLHAIQDVSIRKPPFGLVLNYGTLIVDSGRACEVLTFIPNVDTVAAYLRPTYRGVPYGEAYMPVAGYGYRQGS